jgi:hypothetical protein
MHLLRAGGCCAVVSRPDGTPFGLLSADEADSKSTDQKLLT